jgi:hypothetical protein
MSTSMFWDERLCILLDYSSRFLEKLSPITFYANTGNWSF